MVQSGRAYPAESVVVDAGGVCVAGVGPGAAVGPGVCCGPASPQFVLNPVQVSPRHLSHTGVCTSVQGSSCMSVHQWECVL